MRRYLLPVLGCLAFSTAATADWPVTARSNFIAECVENTQIEHASRDAQAFCECAADQASRQIDPAQLETMGDGTIDPATQDRLIEASRGCATHLSGSQ